MSTDYATLVKVRIADLVDGRLQKFGIREYVDPIWTNATQNVRWPKLGMGVWQQERFCVFDNKMRGQ